MSWKRVAGQWLPSTYDPAQTLELASFHGQRADGTPQAMLADSKGSLSVTNRALERLQAQKMFVADTGKVTLSVAGNFRATFTNPSTSGRNLIIAKLVAADSSSAIAWGEVWKQPTTGLPATAARPNRNLVFLAAGGNDVGVGELRADTDATVALGGGDLVGVIGVPGATRTEIHGPFVLTPGVVIGLNVPYAGAADVAFSVYYYED